MSKLYLESHLVERIGWLRAAVLGANDGIVSTASLIVGVAAASARPGDILIAGVAGLVAGAMSMAAGEYVSVSSQSDTEQADLTRERKELADLSGSSVRSLPTSTSNAAYSRSWRKQVAQQLRAKDALARMPVTSSAFPRSPPRGRCRRHSPPLQPSLPGRRMPLLMVVVMNPLAYLVPKVSLASLIFLGVLGAVGAKAGGADWCGRPARDLLGSAGDGCYGSHWQDLRDHGVARLKVNFRSLP